MTNQDKDKWNQQQGGKENKDAQQRQGDQPGRSNQQQGGGAEEPQKDQSDLTRGSTSNKNVND